jgi:hypothetical protein
MGENLQKNYPIDLSFCMNTHHEINKVNDKNTLRQP